MWFLEASLFLKMFSEDFLGLGIFDDDGILFLGRFKDGSAPGIKDDLPLSKKEGDYDEPVAFSIATIKDTFQRHRSSISMK